MEDIRGVLSSLPDLQRELEALREAHFADLNHLFFGTGPAPADPEASAKAADRDSSKGAPPRGQDNASVTPQQTKKRAKRLSSLAEDVSEGKWAPLATAAETSARHSARMSNSQLLSIAEDNLNSTASLMPPPPAPATAQADTTLGSGRPQRAAKLKSEKLLKEPPLNRKMRRPSNEDVVKVKLESEQRASQFNSSTSKRSTQNKTQTQAQTEAPNPKQAHNPTQEEETPEEPAQRKSAEQEVLADGAKGLRVKIKREKMSTDSTAMPPPSAEVSNSTTTTLEATVANVTRPDETYVTNTTTTSEEAGKKGRKKNQNHRPIKVERFSDLEKGSPVASRTRKCSTESRTNQERSIYKDALEEPTVEPKSAKAAAPAAPGINNETVTISNATMVLGPAPTDESVRLPAADATFEVRSADKQQAERPATRDSIMTEDDSLEEKKLPAVKTLPNLKAIKLPVRTHELFNPLLQSPVKLRVEAFENAANAQANMRPKRIKEVLGTNTTPQVGKLPPPTVGRFFTPTQASSMVPLNSAQPKKAPASASKATTLMKTATGTNLKSTNSTSTKTLSRENSGDDFRKGLHNLADERKKQREQKHLQAAQQREARDRERAERMAKVAAERAKKQEERKRMEERKRQELEEQQRKLRQQEEAEALRKAKLREQEQQKLQQLTGAKAKKMLPPPPKTKYTWEMLHEDDSTDDEGKVTHKRPPAPTWSRSHVRGDAITMQSHCPTDVIDSFFSVAPTTPDLRLIFPNIDPSQLKRNSSVLWSTPPRYSELPKY
ncbi:hypothetical protein KR018_003734 [Drosophila ironensis]|nr:hypothetical protein KR018_003734 [Drosophila ironensis]